METFLWIGIGGVIGANLRYFISTWVAERLGAAFPWGTLIVNLSGSCLLAVFLTFANNHVDFDPRVRLLVATGFFGAYTTFSTYANETVMLFRAKDWIGGIANLVGSNLISIIGVLIGLFIGSHL